MRSIESLEARHADGLLVVRNEAVVGDDLLALVAVEALFVPFLASPFKLLDACHITQQHRPSAWKYFSRRWQISEFKIVTSMDKIFCVTDAKTQFDEA